MVGKPYNASSCNEGGCKAQNREAMDGEAVGEQKNGLGDQKWHWAIAALVTISGCFC